MGDILYQYENWIKAFHIIAVISWMAGIFYLPRLFVHHTENVQVGSDTDVLFKMMEEKLLRVIMNPAMIVTWVCGFLLVARPDAIDWSMIWPWTKLISVLAMTWFHMWLSKQRKELASGQRRLSGKAFRMMNEVPTILMIVIIVSVVVRPF